MSIVEEEAKITQKLIEEEELDQIIFEEIMYDDLSPRGKNVKKENRAC